MTKALYEFFWDCGRMGEVEGRFLAEPLEIEKSIGKKVYFGEILGKHSEVYGVLKDEDVKVLTDDQTFLEMAEKIGIDLSSGYNPLEYLDEEE